MTDYYVDSNSGSNGDTGLTQALAWATVEFALESATPADGDTIWVRRTHSEVPVSDIIVNTDNVFGSPIKIVGWSRPAIPNTTITEGDWTNGSATVDNIVGITCAKTSHQARYCTGPDGETYFITRVVDTNTIMIDREYPSATVSGVNGKFQIEADEETTPADVDGWDNDALTLPVVDFNDGNLKVTFSSDMCYIFKNMHFMDSGENDGMVYCLASGYTEFVNCLFTQTASNDPLIGASAQEIIIRACTFEGSGSGTAQTANYYSGGVYHMKDVAIYNMGDAGISPGDDSAFYLENVNIGVEIANGDDDIFVRSGGIVWGRDVKLGGTNGDIATATNGAVCFWNIHFENYNKILGAHKTWNHLNIIESAAVTGETPNKKVSDDVIKITDFADKAFPDREGIAPHYAVFTHEFDATTDSLTYKYWLYNDSGATLNDTAFDDDFWLKIEYIKVYDDTSEYVFDYAYSTEIDILDAADADDWDYLQATAQPGVASKVRIICYSRWYDATGSVFIDPAVVIS